MKREKERALTPAQQERNSRATNAAIEQYCCCALPRRRVLHHFRLGANFLTRNASLPSSRCKLSKAPSTMLSPIALLSLSLSFLHRQHAPINQHGRRAAAAAAACVCVYVRTCEDSPSENKNAAFDRRRNDRLGRRCTSGCL